MRVVIVSKALIVGAYQRKAELIAQLGVDLTVLIPPAWEDRRGRQQAETLHSDGYSLQIIPIYFNGNYHLHFYPTLARELQRLRPDLVHVDEEPYNLATWLAIRAARRVGAKTTFFTWQNLLRHYPPPFSWMEQAAYRACPVAIAGNQDAAGVLRQKGYQGEIQVIPQFGVDPAIFAPPTVQWQEPSGQESNGQEHVFHIGYAGGLIPEKGLDLLIRASATLQGEWKLSLVGSGSEEAALQQLAQTLGVAHRVESGRRLPSHQMADFYRSLDVLVLPSRTLPNWKEQFGRVLIEAMACGIPVIGSETGEIPHVLGDAGLLFAEEDSLTLHTHLQRLLDDPEERRRLGMAGRQRVLDRFTMQQIAQETVAVYQRFVQP
jgi:glycosyltransferase involved in cell wall biosynthesis